MVAQSDPARSAPQVGDVRSDAYTVGSPHPPLEGQVDFAATASTWRVNPRCFILKLRLPARSPYFAAGVRRTSARVRSLCQSPPATPHADSQSWRFRFPWWFFGPVHIVVSPADKEAPPGSGVLGPPADASQ